MKKSRLGKPRQHEPKPPMTSLLAQILRGERCHVLSRYSLDNRTVFSFAVVMATMGHVRDDRRADLIRAFLDFQRHKGDKETAYQCVSVFRALDRVPMALRFINQTNGLCESQRTWFNFMENLLLKS